MASEELQAEAEALGYTYGEALQQDPQLSSFSMLVQPYTADDASQQYVECRITLTAPPGYPAAAPAISITDCRGMSGEREAALLQQLQTELEQLSGEMVLGHLFETARNSLTAMNCPEGPCCFCLEPVDSSSSSDNSSSNNNSSSSSSSSQPPLRLPCFHAFHRSCFIDWWLWQQSALLGQAQDLVERAGATAAVGLIQEALPPIDPGGGRQLCCPLCRAPFQLSDLWGLQGQLAAAFSQLLERQGSSQVQALHHNLQGGAAGLGQTQDEVQEEGQGEEGEQEVLSKEQRLQALLGDEVAAALAQRLRISSGGQTAETAAAAAAAAGTSGTASGGRLTAQQLAPWKQVQVKHAAMFAAQMQRGGIITV